MLGEIGKGHKIAFNILNIGRLKLCAAALGGARRSLSGTVEYAKTREQFKQPISNFGAIKHKLAEMAIKVFVTESALHRTAKWIDEKEHELLSEGKPFREALLGGAEEYAIECAILKVYGSEVLDYVEMKEYRYMAVMVLVLNRIFQELIVTVASTVFTKEPMRSTGCWFWI